MTVRDIRAMDRTMLDRLNSATKYPSIPTYHMLDPKGRGRLTGALEVDFSDVEKVEVSEKINGTNTRLVFPPNGDLPLIGSRAELLTFLGDVVHNPSQGIVDAVRDTAARLHDTGDVIDSESWIVIYGEVYGGKVNGGKDYAGDGVTTGFRVFDVASVPVDVLDRPREEIATWRDHGGQPFWDTTDRDDIATELGLETVPVLGTFAVKDGFGPPVSLGDTWTWLRAVSTTSRAALDDAARKVSEGVVIRTPGRGLIAKIRHEDYKRTLGVGK